MHRIPFYKKRNDCRALRRGCGLHMMVEKRKMVGIDFNMSNKY
jgi:hypothetical protein